LAEGMHNDKPQVIFATSIGSPNTLTVNVDASAAKCSGSAANCDAYEWNWGDGMPDGSGVTTSHTYAAAGSYQITLTVEEYGVGGASATRTVNASTPDYPPTAASVCTFNADTWTLTVTDASMDDDGINQVTVNWGDGTVISSDTTGPAFGPFTHTFLNRGTYTVTHKAIDSIGQQATSTCVVSPAYFTIGGTVYRPGGTLPLAGAIVTAKKGVLVVGTAYSASDGSFTVGNLKPGAYTLTVVRSGYTFTAPAASVTVGPSSAGNNITALTGLLTAPKNLTKDRKKPHHGAGATASGPVIAPAP
jgi:PKD repeat protein